MPDAISLTWPHIFAEPTMDRSQSAFMGGGESVPWLVGIDGRYRGGLKTFDGLLHYDRFPAQKKVGVLIISDNSLIVGGVTTVTLPDSGTFTFGGAVAIGADAYATALNVKNYLDATPAKWANVVRGRYTTEAGATSDTFAWVTFEYVGALTTGDFSVTPNNGLSIDPVSTSGGGPGVTCTNFVHALGTTDRQVTFVQYVEILKSANTIIRGFVVRMGPTLYFVYKDGVGGSGLTNYYVIDRSATWTNYRVSVAARGRILYITGRDHTDTTNIQFVVHWHPKYNILVTRQFGQGTVSKQTPTAVSGNGVLPLVFTLAPGGYQANYRYYDPLRLRWTSLSETDSLNESLTFVPDGSVLYNMAVANIGLRSTALLADYGQVEIFSTISSGLKPNNTANPPGGLFFLRNRGEWPANPLIADELTYGAGRNTGSEDLYDLMSDESLVEQDRYDRRADLVLEPPQPVIESIAQYQSTTFAAVVAEGFIDIRWSPLDRLEPENLLALNVKRTKIRASQGAHFIQAGDFLYLLGDGESYRIQRIGSSLSIHRVLDGYRFCGPTSSCAIGSLILAVSETGVVIINANTADTQHLSMLDRFVLQRWAKNLDNKVADTTTTDGLEGIQCAYDSKLGCAFIYHKPLAECLCIWLTSSRVSMLTDCNWAALVQARLPNTGQQGLRAFVITEGQGYGVSAAAADAGPRFLYFANINPTSPGPNALGLDGCGFTSGILPVTSSAFAAGETVITITGGPNTQAGDLVGGTVYVAAGSMAGTNYTILSNTAHAAGSITVTVSGDASSNIQNGDYISLCPVVLGAMQGPLASPTFAGDILSRRVVDGAVAPVVVFTDGNGQGNFPAGAYSTARLDMSSIIYGLSRNTDSNDNFIHASQATYAMNATPVYPGGTPWAQTWTALGGIDETFDPDTAAIVGSAGLFGNLEGDGGLVYPSFKIVLSGVLAIVPSLYVTGRVLPNQSVDTA